MLEQRIEQDLKTALLAGDTQRVSILRGLKSALLNVKVATNKRDSGLTDDEVLAVLAKQAKQCQESARLYIQGGDQARADAELAEKAIIDSYLPPQLSEAEIGRIVAEVIKENNAQGPAAVGQVIAATRAKTANRADGAVIARIAKDHLGQ